VISAAIVAEVKAAHPGVELHLVELGDAAFIVRKPSLAEYAPYWEETSGKLASGQGGAAVVAAENNLAIACTVWPNPVDFAAQIEAAPGILRSLVAEIVDLAGENEEEFINAVELEASNLETNEVEALRAAKVTMRPSDRFVHGPDGVIVFARPSRANWEANRTSRIGKPLKMEMVQQLCFDSVRYPSAEALKQIYERLPALASFHHVALRRMAGADLEARKKRI
jgi:hypothetical protein